MTAELEEQIEQRERMLASINANIKDAEARGDKHVVFVKTQRKQELERQLAELKPKAPKPIVGNPS